MLSGRAIVHQPDPPPRLCRDWNVYQKGPEPKLWASLVDRSRENLTAADEPGQVVPSLN